MIETYFKNIAQTLIRFYHRSLYIPPKNRKELTKFIEGGYEYEDLPNGFVKIVGNWKENNIVTIPLPIKNPQTKTYWTINCNRKISTLLYGIFQEYVTQGYERVYPIRQLGCFVPRHKMNDPKRSLSLHSYGIAIDVNWRTNPVGKNGDMSKDLIRIFRRYGWTWGGSWRRPKDPMHFEYYSGS